MVARKVAELRIFADDHRPMNRSVTDVGGAVLVVSQFTLFGDVRRGRRPSFDGAAEPGLAERLYLELGRFEAGDAVSRTHQDVEGQYHRESFHKRHPEHSQPERVAISLQIDGQSQKRLHEGPEKGYVK